MFYFLLETFTFSEDSLSELSSDDDMSSLKSSELENTSKTSERCRSERDNNDNDINDEENDDSSSFLSRKRRKASSRSAASQKRIISDEDDNDDSDDDDLELSRISEMVKRKRLAKAEKSERRKVLLSSHEEELEDELGKEAKRAPPETQSGKTSSENLDKNVVSMKEVSSDRASRPQKRKRKTSQRGYEAESPIKKRAKQGSNVDIQKSHRKYKKEIQNEQETFTHRKSRETASREDSADKRDSTSEANPGAADSVSYGGDDGCFYESSPRDRERLDSCDKNPYISDISDAEADDGNDERKRSNVTSDMFRANIFTNAFDKFAAQGPLQDADHVLKVGTVEMEGRVDQKDSLLANAIVVDDATECSVLHKRFEEGENDMTRKVDAEKIIQEEYKSTLTNDSKHDGTKLGKKNIKDKNSDSIEVIIKRRKKKKSESSWEDCLSRESANKQTVLEGKKHSGSLDALKEASQLDLVRRKEASLLPVVKRLKETEWTGEKPIKSSDLCERKLDVDASFGRHDIELEDGSPKILKKMKKKKSKRCDLEVGEKIAKTVKEEESIDESQSLKSRCYSDESVANGGLTVCLKNEQPESKKEEYCKTGSSPVTSKSKPIKEKSSVTGLKQISRNVGDEKRESWHKSLRVDSSKSESNSCSTSRRSEEPGSGINEIARSVSDKEKTKESRKERGSESINKDLSNSQKVHSKKVKLGSDSMKKSRKEQTSKAEALSKSTEKVKETDRDSKGFGGDGTKLMESIGKLREKVSKSQQEIKNLTRGLKEDKIDLKRDNDQQNKDFERKGAKEHKKVVNKDGKESKVNSSREKESKQIDGAAKVSPIKDANDGKSTVKKEHRTPVKSKEVDLKIWDFGLPSPVKMQRLSKPKEHKKVHSKDGKPKKAVKPMEPKENLQKEKKLDSQDSQMTVTSEMKSVSMQSVEPVSKRAFEEPTTLPIVQDDNVLEHVENEENRGVSIDDSPVKDKDCSRVDDNVSEKPIESKGDPSFQLEPLGKVAFEASDATSMDSPQTSQKTFETTSEDIDATCNAPKTSEIFSEADPTETQSIEKETIESIADNRNEKLEEVADEEKPIVVQDENANDDGGDVDAKEKSITEEEPKNEDHGSPLLLDKLSELGAGSDFEDHLGPFHGTKLEETDIDIRELSHPEDTLKMLTQEINGHEASMQESKLSGTHEYPAVRMTGHDFTMLSEQINEKIQRLSSRSFVSELSEEEKHIVNISMEIAEDLSQEGDEHVRNLTQADSTMRQSAVTEGDSHKVLPGSISRTQEELDESGRQAFHSETQCIPSTPSISTTCVSMAETATENIADSKIVIGKEERPLSVDPGVVKTSPPVSHQDTEVARPLFARSRTVDLEPRGIAQVVADIDLNSISSCILSREKSMDTSVAGVDTYGGEGMINDVSNDSHTSKETRFSEESSRDRLKKKANFMSSPTTWRKALLTEYGYSKPDLPLQFRNFTVMNGNYHQAEAEIDNEV